MLLTFLLDTGFFADLMGFRLELSLLDFLVGFVLEHLFFFVDGVESLDVEVPVLLLFPDSEDVGFVCIEGVVALHRPSYE